MSNGYIGGACPYKNNGFGGGDAHAPHICRCENQLVVASVDRSIGEFGECVHVSAGVCVSREIGKNWRKKGLGTQLPSGLWQCFGNNFLIKIDSLG